MVDPEFPVWWGEGVGLTLLGGANLRRGHFLEENKRDSKRNERKGEGKKKQRKATRIKGKRNTKKKERLERKQMKEGRTEEREAFWKEGRKQKKTYPMAPPLPLSTHYGRSDIRIKSNIECNLQK